jgi:hypothetical protein
MADRKSIYRHAHALGFFAKRDWDTRAVLAKTWTNPGSLCNGRGDSGSNPGLLQDQSGRPARREKRLNLNDRFARMTSGELESGRQTSGMVSRVLAR